MAEIALLTLANHAEVQNGLLYLVGAEGDTVTRTTHPSGTPNRQHIAIAISLVIEWTEANTPQTVAVRMEDEDSRHKLLETQINVEVGRPAGRPHGSPFRSPLAITAEIEFPRVGGHRIVAEVGDRQRTYSFRVVDRVAETPRPAP